MNTTDTHNRTQDRTNVFYAATVAALFLVALLMTFDLRIGSAVAVPAILLVYTTSQQSVQPPTPERRRLHYQVVGLCVLGGAAIGLVVGALF